MIQLHVKISDAKASDPGQLDDLILFFNTNECMWCRLARNVRKSPSWDVFSHRREAFFASQMRVSRFRKLNLKNHCERDRSHAQSLIRRSAVDRHTVAFRLRDTTHISHSTVDIEFDSIYIYFHRKYWFSFDEKWIFNFRSFIRFRCRSELRANCTEEPGRQ